MTTLTSGRGRPRLPSRGGLLVAAGAALAASLALLLVRTSAFPLAAGLAVLPPAVWLVTRSYGGLALGLVLTFVLPYWYQLGSSHLTILRAASLAATVTLLVNRRTTLRRIDLALMVLVLLLVGDWLFQYRQPGAGSALVAELVPIGFYLGARGLPPRHIRTVALIVVLAGALGGLTVIYEFTRGSVIFHDPTSYDWNKTNDSIFRPGGIFGSPPAASTVMCGVILFGVALMSTYRGKKRLLVGFCTVIASVALLLTFTRAAMIAAGLGIILLLWLMRSPLLRPLRVAWFLALLAAVYFLLIPSLQGSRTFQLGIERSGTLAAREGYWGVALPVATSSAHQFILGAGTGSLEAVRTAPNATVASRIATSPTLTGNSLHSQYITTLVEQGVIGLAALVALLLAGAVPSARIARATRDPIVAATAATILAMALIMTVATVSIDAPAAVMLMLALGFAGALQEEGRTNFGQTAE